MKRHLKQHKSSFLLNILHLSQSMEKEKIFQKHNNQNVHKVEYQLQQSPLTNFTFFFVFGSLMWEWKLEKALSCNRSLSPDEHAYFTLNYFNYGSS